MYLMRSTCRACEGTNLEVVFTQESTPLPNALLLPSQLEQAERRYPLDLAFCRDCSLLQVLQTVSPSEIYDDRYLFLSGASERYAEYQGHLAAQLIHNTHMDSNSLVIEVGSNDGTTLMHFQARGVTTLGIDPAPVPASEARRAGIATLPGFFNREVASHLVSEGRRADLVLLTNVLSRVPDLHGFLAGIRILLKEEGMVVIEEPYVRGLVAGGGFDAISHEHLCYFSVTTLRPLLESAGLHLCSIQQVGTDLAPALRFFVSRQGHADSSVADFLQSEADGGLTQPEFYSTLPRHAEAVRHQVLALMEELKSRGGHIVGYGAAAQGSTMLNYCGIDETFLDYIVDSNAQKQGRFMPGVHLPVLSPDSLLSNHPDYVLLLSRACQEEVLSQQQEYRQQGGRFIITIPRPTIL